jgi:hypothetical protein
MQGATHFIEIYKGRFTNYIMSGYPMPISEMSEALKRTRESENLETVAVWKIKKKMQRP